MASLLLEQRRGSAASSVSVTIETVTTTTTRFEDLAPTDEAPVTFVSPCPPSSRRGSTAGIVPPSRQAAPTPSSTSHVPSCAFPPPPPYADPAPTHRATVHPLFFFAFSSSSPPRRPSLPDAHIIDMPSPLPPAYAAGPRTEAERRFWHGFLCPVLWLLGARRIWRSERPMAALDGLGGAAAKDDEAELEAGEGAQGWCALPPDVRESVELWREEELVWARRCLWALFVMVGAAGILTLALLSVLNVMG
ncbi:hypothetical protein JCM9279_003690 [Rhodotorula babjevae]